MKIRSQIKSENIDQFKLSLTFHWLGSFGDLLARCKHLFVLLLQKIATQVSTLKDRLKSYNSNSEAKQGSYDC